MAHPEIENRTGMHLGLTTGMGTEGEQRLAVVIKGTFDIRAGELTLAEKQLELWPAGVPATQKTPSSYRYEPECAYFKPATDVSLVGHAYPRKRGDRSVDVSFEVGTLKKTLRVFGDRVWEKTLGSVVNTPPQPLEPVPLVYERAFGGWDTPEPDPVSGRFEPRNPVGVGFKRKNFVEGLPLPNIEDPRCLMGRYGDTPRPAGVGVTSPDWQPRAGLAGTYDEAWQRDRAPRLPKDFDPRFFNSAAEGLVANGYLRGDESVIVRNASSQGEVFFQLPKIPPPMIRVRTRRGPTHESSTVLDTVVVNTDDMQVLMLWRTHCELTAGMLDVVAIAAN